MFLPNSIATLLHCIILTLLSYLTGQPGDRISTILALYIDIEDAHLLPAVCVTAIAVIIIYVGIFSINIGFLSFIFISCTH